MYKDLKTEVDALCGRPIESSQVQAFIDVLTSLFDNIDRRLTALEYRASQVETDVLPFRNIGPCSNYDNDWDRKSEELAQEIKKITEEEDGRNTRS